MDQEILQLTERIKCFKMERNTLSSVPLVPDDLMLHIFFVYGTMIEDPFRGAWAKLMLVCHRWREFCLSHASLWSFFSPRGISSLDFQERLKRSVQYPLSMQSDFPKDSMGVATFAMRQKWRGIRSLKVHTGTVTDFDRVFTDTLSKRCPSLQSCNLILGWASIRASNHVWKRLLLLRSSLSP